MKIARALISLSDKTGLVPFARALTEEFGVEILSTGGTAKLLREEKIPVTEVADFTGFPEILSGRVKTLHPRIHGGLLYLRGNAEHEKQVQGERHPAHRPRRGEPVPVPGDRRQTGRDAGGGD